jgi:hypothetical protein
MSSQGIVAEPMMERLLALEGQVRTLRRLLMLAGVTFSVIICSAFVYPRWQQGEFIRSLVVTSDTGEKRAEISVPFVPGTGSQLRLFDDVGNNSIEIASGRDDPLVALHHSGVKRVSISPRGSVIVFRDSQGKRRMEVSLGGYGEMPMLRFYNQDETPQSMLYATDRGISFSLFSIIDGKSETLGGIALSQNPLARGPSLSLILFDADGQTLWEVP